ncbi:MAG: potassium channel protein [Bacteroidetes bacterium HGW-Bacteroidetes-3]|nr:MAG: potassium channel protein [Bacteroidetes bacterium HGW-Bacteroidetes-3]
MIFKTKLYVSIIFFIAVVSIGIIGYTIFSETNFLDSLYMTIITMTTVGFGEIHPLNEHEKIFTIFLILISIVVYAYSVTALSEYLVNGKLLQHLKLRKVQQKIQNLKNHAIVCGYGRNGKQAVIKSQNFNMPCVVIEKDKALIEQLERDNILYVEGDATQDESIQKAAVHNAKSLITALASDADNLFVVLSARQLNKDMTIISRASNESSINKLKIAGANNIIMPDKIGGMHMASLVVTPDLVEFVDKLAMLDKSATNLEEIAVNGLPAEYLNKTIRDLDLRRRTGCSVIGFKTAANDYIVNPESETKLTVDSNLIVLGRPNQIKKLRETL